MDRKQKRKLRVRRKLRGSSAKPRLCVVRSNAHLFAQVIDDEAGKTLVGMRAKKGISAGKELGEKIGEFAKKQNIERVVFDRGAWKYHGSIKAVAEGARSAGLEF